MQGQGDTIVVTIPNWDKFNPRNDRTNHVWYRFQNGFFTHEKIFPLSSEQQRLLIMIYCLCSKDNHGTVNFCISLNSAILKRRPRQIVSDLKILENSKLVLTAESRLDDGQLTLNGTATYSTRPSAGNKHTNSEFDFDKIFENYPRQEGKFGGIEYCSFHIKTEIDYLKLKSSVERYKKLCKIERREKKHIKTFANFMIEKVWLDFAEDPKEAIVKTKTPEGIPEEINKEKELPSPEARAKVRNLMASLKVNSLDDPPGAA